MANDYLNTAVPPITITEEGITVPSPDETLQGRLTDFVNALGNASRELSSPQGQMAVSDAAILTDMHDAILTLGNQINPDFAQGRFQDGIGRLYFMDRNQGRGTVVVASCYGKSGTSLPAGTRARDTAGNIYESTLTASIPDSGVVSVQFANIKLGPIPCEPHALNTIYTPISGWDRVDNDNAGALGNYAESAASFEARRRDSVALNARNTDQAILGQLLNTKGVLDAYVWSNRNPYDVKQGSTQVAITAKSVYICVAGGEAEDIANAIALKYNPSGGMVGDTTAIWEDTTYNKPYPQFELTWQTAKPTPVYFKVTLLAGDNERPEIEANIKKVIVAVFSGTSANSPVYSGNMRERIGGLVAASRYYKPVIDVDTASVNLVSLEVSLKKDSDFSSSVQIGIDQVPTISEDNITISFVES